MGINLLPKLWLVGVKPQITRVEERCALDEEWVRTDFDKAEVRMLA